MIPKIIKIGGLNYTVEELSPGPARDDYMGYTDVSRATISLNPEMHPDVQAHVLLHEVLEAVNFVYGVELEHRQIEILEGALFQVLKDNPGLMG